MGGGELSKLFHHKTFFPVYVYFLTASSVTCYNTAELGGLELGFPAWYNSYWYTVKKSKFYGIFFLDSSEYRNTGINPQCRFIPEL